MNDHKMTNIKQLAKSYFKETVSIIFKDLKENNNCC